MTKSELITHIAERLPYLTRKDAEIIVDRIFGSMADALVQGEHVEIRGFGSFTAKHLKEHEGRNPKTGESIRIPARRLPFFKIGKGLHERINRTVPSSGSMEEDS